MIVLYTDFSLLGPYVGELKSAILKENPESIILDLMHDAPMFDVKHAACLLSHVVQFFPAKSVFCCVVDPGVGSERNAIAVKINNQYFVGPDNGLFEYVIRENKDVEFFKITWRPEKLSSTFHGRDIFGPIAAKINRNQFGGIEKINSDSIVRAEWPSDLYEIIYIDSFGNLMTGINNISVTDKSILIFNDVSVEYAATYSLMPDGQLCWYINSNQLVEIGMSSKSAAELFNAKIGDSINISL